MSFTASYRAAQSVISFLVGQGVRHWVYCPGSRCAPLGYVLFEAAARNQITLSVRVDERGAAFEALGMARAAGIAAVVMTSGTAVANAHPAVLEARHSGTPLVVLSADRPAALRFTGANQTTDQREIYGRAALGAWDIQSPQSGQETDASALASQLQEAVDIARGRVADRAGDRSLQPGGPVQINLGLTEPLTPQPAALPAKTNAAARNPLPASVEPTTVVVCGDGADTSAQLWEAVEKAALPVLAEPHSGWRTHSGAVVAYRELLSRLPHGAVSRVIVNGRPTLSRPVNALISRRDIPVEVFGAHVAAINPAQNIARHWADVPSLVASLPGCPRDCSPGAKPQVLQQWQQAGRQIARAALAIPTEAGQTKEQIALAGLDNALLHVARDLWQLPEQLLLAASLPIRAFDLVAGVDGGSGPERVFANRGLAGIDGTIATARGLALASGKLTRVVVGDLAFWHDVGSLGRGQLETEAPLQIVLIDNGGGQIFSTLEHARAADQQLFKRLFLTPQNGQVARAAATWGWDYRPVHTWGQLAPALRESPEHSLVHVCLTPAQLEPTAQLERTVQPHAKNQKKTGRKGR